MQSIAKNNLEPVKLEATEVDAAITVFITAIYRKRDGKWYVDGYPLGHRTKEAALAYHADESSDETVIRIYEVAVPVEFPKK